MEYIIRPLTTSDLTFQEEMLYQSLYIPEEREVYPRDIIFNPLIYKYIKNWGREGDYGLIAESGENHQPIGAAWYRFFPENDKGLGFINASTPELTMAVAYEFRNKGIGTKLITNLIHHAIKVGIKGMSLSVIPENTAVHLYERMGFKVVNSELPHLVMKLDL